jgi:anti-sigma regulatory factor (Ser/Thr protein kinase)
MSGADDDGDGAEPAVQPPPVGLELRFLAEPSAVPAMRHRVREWLTALDWPLNELDDLLIATSEACTNAVEHAYLPGVAGDVTVSLRVTMSGDCRRVVAIIRDRGHWRPIPIDPGFRGHGLTVMRGLTDRMRIRRDHHGTLIRMISYPVPVLVALDEVRPG